MGRLDIAPKLDPNEFRVFTKALLNDLRALEQMLTEGRIETGAHRIGTEQELFLVDRGWRPAQALSPADICPLSTCSDDQQLHRWSKLR